MRVALLAAGLIALVVLAVLALERNDDVVAVDQALTGQRVLATTIAGDLVDWLSWQHSSVASLASRQGFEILTPAEKAAAMNELHAAYPHITTFVSYDVSGRVVARTRSGSGPRALRMRVFEQARDMTGDPIAVGPSRRDPNRGSFVVGARMEDAVGQFGGALEAIGDLAELSAVLRRSAGTDDREVYLLDQDGQVIAPPGASVVYSGARLDSGTSAGAVRLPADDPLGERLVGFARVGSLGWEVVTALPATRVTAPIDQVHETLFGTMLLMIAIVVVIAGVVARAMLWPLRIIPLAAARPIDKPSLGASSRESNRTLAALVRASPLAVVVADTYGMVTAWNPAAERLFGWTAAEAEGRPVSQFLEHSWPEIEQAAEGGSRPPIETRRRTRRGELVEAAVWAAHLVPESDYSEGVLLIVADIAERKRLDEERARLMREETARHEALALQRRLTFLAEASAELNVSLEFETTRDTAVRVAVPELADWCILELLEQAEEPQTALAASMDARLAEGVRDLCRRRPLSQVLDSPTARALQTGEPVLVAEVSAEALFESAPDISAKDLALLRSLGRLSVIAVPLPARDRLLGVMTLIALDRRHQFDATDLALTEALVRRCAVALENARLYREAQEALRARDTFLSIASHELGSPLARVKAYAEVLLMAHSRKQLDERLLNRSLHSIDRATSRLTTITQDLFDVSRLRLGDLQLRPFRLSLARLVREVVRHHLDELGEAHKLTLSVARGSYPVEVDPDRIEQVLDNVLRNAVKYSPDGGSITVTLRPEDEGALLQIRDQGIGLPPAAIDAIFEPFGRAPNAERRNVPGMGLGLYISRSIVERHAGRIWAESPGEHQGMTISIWLPLVARPPVRR
jgi:PAS domain S-box-containing protein